MKMLEHTKFLFEIPIPIGLGLETGVPSIPKKPLLVFAKHFVGGRTPPNLEAFMPTKLRHVVLEVVTPEVMRL